MPMLFWLPLSLYPAGGLRLQGSSDHRGAGQSADVLPPAP